MNDHTQRAHSEWGASSADRWMNCFGSIQLIRTVTTKEKESVYAAEGTAAHELAEECLLNNGEADTYLGTEWNGFKVTEEMAEAVQVYLDEVRSHYEGQDNAQLHVEERFHLDNVDEEMFGTNDACIVNGRKVTILDYKHGRGIAVEVENNPQLMIYALGATKGMDFDTAELIIVQPRADHPDGPIRKWSISSKELKAFAHTLKKAIAITRSKDATLVPTDKGCRFCRAKAICPAIREKAYAVAKVEFDDDLKPSLPEPEALSNDEIIKVLNSASLIKDWISEVQSFAHAKVEGGRKLEGFKLVKKRANRKWKDQDEVVDYFSAILDEDQFYEKKLLTPAKLEKIVGKEDVNKLTTTPDSGSVLVLKSDRRKELIPMVEAVFDDQEIDI